MNNRISRINKSFSVLITLIVASQGSIQAPVACFDSDGQVNVELGCEFDLCEINFNDENNQFDSCQECVDIPLWPYTPEFNQAVKTDNWSLDLTSVNIITHNAFICEQYFNYNDPTRNILDPKTQPQLAILSTRLLI